MRQVKLRRRIELESAMPYVAHNTDNRHPFRVWSARIIRCDPPADRVLIRKPFARERLVDDNRTRRVAAIVLPSGFEPLVQVSLIPSESI